MNATAVVPPQVPTNPLSQLRLIPRIETYPKLLDFAQTHSGKVAIWSVFVAGLIYFLRSTRDWLPVAIALLLISVLPRYRWLLVALSTLVITGLQSGSLTFVAAPAFGAVLFWCARRWPDSEFGRKPVRYLLLGCTLLLVVCSALPRGPAQSRSTLLLAWNAAGLAVTYMWFVGYALMDRSSKPSKDLPLEVGSWWPFWGSTTTPFPKGAAYLRRIEAQNAEQFAVTQLKGVKLLAWAIALELLFRAWIFVFHGYFHIPWAAEALTRSVQRQPFSWYVCWASQILAFFELIFRFAIFGHRCIACCRFAGFNALRNTYRPLSSRTVNEFFNRFYFYFKELLVDFFFYPVFFRYFKRHPRLRLVTATFAAAAFGNMFFHFTRDYWIIQRVGLVNAVINFQVFAFYCVALATALSISQLRKRKAPHTGLLRGRILPSAWVLFVYCILGVFGATTREYPLTEHFRFLGHMFGLNW